MLRVNTKGSIPPEEEERVAEIMCGLIYSQNERNKCSVYLSPDSISINVRKRLKDLLSKENIAVGKKDSFKIRFFCARRGREFY